MKCQERELLIEELIRSLPSVEHELLNVSSSDEYEHYMCRHCMGIEKRMRARPGGEAP